MRGTSRCSHAEPTQAVRAGGREGQSEDAVTRRCPRSAGRRGGLAAVVRSSRPPGPAPAAPRALHGVPPPALPGPRVRAGRVPWGAWRGSQPDWWPSLCKHDPFLGTAAEERAEVSVTATHVTRDFPGPSFPLINAACPRPNRNFLWCFLKILKLNTLTTINFLFHVTSRFYC